MSRTAACLIGGIHRWMEKLTAFLNGLAGDYMEEVGSHLAVPMAFYREGRPVAPGDAATAGRATGKVAVFVHGLCCTERVFDFPGQPGVTYGMMLEKDLGYTPCFVRYNTGVRVEENGKRLSRLVDELAAAYPVPVTEILFVGHSMGGLVAKCAIADGFSRKASWTEASLASVYLGTPHRGAPLEKGVHLATRLLGLAGFPLAVSLRDFLDFRSAAIKDLRFGRVVDNHDGFSRVRQLAVAGTFTTDPGHPASLALGDLLVRVQSARAAAASRGLEPGADFLLAAGLHHFALARDMGVYRKIAAWTAGKPVPLPGGDEAGADAQARVFPVSDNTMKPKRREPCPSF